MAILLLGLGCFLSLNQVHGAPADGDDAEEEGEEGEEAGEEEDGGEATEDDHCSCGSAQINSSQPKKHTNFHSGLYAS